ncbi:saccharopine dehydrogenase NADP-binding domain-containing protein [Micromonospora sp. CNB394]|uniref:saccharopine dehydrogenase NADP-binding domain-containing protein n=1 Tax=Micromonospora sp. CNB394 TaxID=1169151 RepID=UPI00035C0FEC|nr:saccharopine dehydrogenase NADP-binding domain-containing protein [Micromonospora sp. CNB394]
MIGVLGASGAVGREAVRALRNSGTGPLRLGARRTSSLSAADGEVRTVDVTDAGSLKEFCAGLTVLINCAGPTYALQERMALSALAAGAHYVDVGGDDPVHERLAAAGAVRGDATVVLSAGALPGLSALVPRWLAARWPDGDRLVCHAGGLEKCTPTVAEEILLSLSVGGAHGEPFGMPLAAWRNGRRALRALRTVEDEELPDFPDRAMLQPILTAESERLAVMLRLDELDFFNVYPGPRVRALFARLPLLAAEGRDDLVQRIVTAGDVDLAGRDPYYRMRFTLGGPGSGHTAVVSADSSYRLTAAVGVLAVRAVMDGALPAGLHFGGDVLDPGWAVEEINRTGAAEIAVLDDVDEGVL